MLSRDMLVVVANKEIFVHDIARGEMYKRATFENFFGACDLFSNNKSTLVLCYPAKEEGAICIERRDSSHPLITIQAHQSKISYIALSKDGSLVATSSMTGTLIRVFDAKTGEKLKDFRRGSHMATIQCVCFSYCCTMLCCTSDTGTLHVWDLHSENANRTSNLALVNHVVNIEYTTSQWSHAEVKNINSPSLCIFEKNDIISVVSSNGMCTKYCLQKNKLKKIDNYGVIWKNINLDFDSEDEWTILDQ
ncbi:WD repeat-containing protein [Acrasis kona]|uniref:WD repeat-containing protein n=1 Tax=Acrasis kona TaxID=1008807 RepID=A0AAW2ZC79_9EUKA